MAGPHRQGGPVDLPPHTVGAQCPFLLGPVHHARDGRCAGGRPPDSASIGCREGRKQRVDLYERSRVRGASLCLEDTATEADDSTSSSRRRRSRLRTRASQSSVRSLPEVRENVWQGKRADVSAWVLYVATDFEPGLLPRDLRRSGGVRGWN